MGFELEKELYYVCPFTFVIEKVILEFDGGEDPTTKEKYYIEDSGAYLEEDHITATLEEAKGLALSMLNKFYSNKLTEIIQSDPVFVKET